MDLAPLTFDFCSYIFRDIFTKSSFIEFMLKIFKVSLLFTLSLNLFANSITTDFYAKRFQNNL